MTLSLYSFVMAALWFTVFILLGAFLQRKVGFVFCYHLTPLLLLLAVTVFRMVIPIEIHLTVEVPFTSLYPVVQDFLQATLITVGGVAVSATFLLLALWGAVAVFLSARLLWRIQRDLRQLHFVSALPCSEIKTCLARLLSRRGSTRKVNLIVSPDISTPMLVGLFKPVMLLPPECMAFSSAELECILDHELTHLHSNDLWVKFIIRLICCLMWWNPCVYLLKRNLDETLEFKCDLAVTRAMSGREKIEYLQTLLNVLELLQRQPAEEPQAVRVGFCGIAETAVLKRRIELVMDRPDKSKRPAAIAFMAATVVLFIASYSVVFQPASYPPSEDLEHEVFITPETSYILKTADGTYYLMYEDTQFGEVSPESLDDSPLCFLTIQNEVIGD